MLIGIKGYAEKYSFLGLENDKLSLYTKDNPSNFNVVPQQLILISLDPNEKIEVGDLVCDGKYIEKAIVSDYLVSKKVIATQDQLSPEYIQQFIEKYNKDEVKDVEIEMEDCGTSDSTCGLIEHTSSTGERFYMGLRPKLTKGFVNIVKEEPILYTEEEVWKLLESLAEESSNGFLNNYFLKNWFEQNKKK